MITFKNLKSPTNKANLTLKEVSFFYYLNDSMNGVSNERKKIWLLLDSELHNINGSLNKLINDFERIDGKCLRDSYVVGRCQIYVDNIQNINQRGLGFLFKCDII